MWFYLGMSWTHVQNKREPLRCLSRSPTREHSHHPIVPLRSEHSCKNQTSHHRREKDHPSHRSMLDSSSSSGPHRERYRKRVEEVSEHHRPAHQYQMEGSLLSKRVQEARVPKEYLSAKMSLDTYDGLTDPWEHIQNVRGSLELVIHNNDVMCKILPTTFKGNVRRWFNNLKSGSILGF